MGIRPDRPDDAGVLDALRRPGAFARPLFCAAALVAMAGAVAATAHEPPAAALSLATQGTPSTVGDAVGPPPTRIVGEGAPTIGTTAEGAPPAPGFGGGRPTTTAPGSSTPSSTTVPETTETPGPPVAEEEDIGPVVGRVTDEAQAGLPGICVWAVDPRTGRSELVARTDADGRYRIEGLRADRITLRMCNPDDHVFGWLASTIGPGIDVSNGRQADLDSSLVSLGALRGRVVDLQGRPIAGVCVALAWQRWTPTLTDASGAFTIHHAGVGTYIPDGDSVRLFASCDGGRALPMTFTEFRIPIYTWAETVITADPNGPSPSPKPSCCVGTGPSI